MFERILRWAIRRSSGRMRMKRDLESAESRIRAEITYQTEAYLQGPFRKALHQELSRVLDFKGRSQFTLSESIKTAISVAFSKTGK